MKNDEVISLLQHIIMQGARQAKDLEAGIVNTKLESTENKKNHTIKVELITDGIPVESDPISLENQNAYTLALINLSTKLISIGIHERHKLPF